MTSPEKPSDSSSASAGSPDDVRQALRAVRTQLEIVAFSLLVLTGGLGVFFLREVSHARRQVKELSQVVDHYNKTNRPAMIEIRDKLHEFAKTNPDYNAIFTNYFNPANLSNATQAATADEAGSSPVRMPNMPER